MSHVLGLPVSDRRVKHAAFESWSLYGRTASDLIFFPHINMDDVDVHTVDMSQGATWSEYVQQVMDFGKGAVVTTAHFGSWDMAGAIAARHFPLFAIAETFKDPRLNDLLQGARIAKKVGIIPMENSGRRVVEELGNNHLVAIAVDRPSTKEKGVEVTFFGHKTYVPGGPAALALKAGSAVLPGYVWYGPDHHYCIRAFPPIFSQPVDNPEERAQEIQRLTQYMYSCQEEVIREWPTQWFMFRPFWPKQAGVAESGPRE
jgi:KDO2-lipid IV(A) lauroyltransferase